MKKLSSWLAAAMLVLSACWTGSSSHSRGTDRGLFFGEDWKFSLTDDPSAGGPGFDDRNWRTLDLPHDWSIEGTIDRNNPTGQAGGFFPAGAGWYRKHFRIPAEWADKRVSVYFGGVYMNAEVFINGHSLGVHPYGYTSFFHDLTEHLRPDSENVLAVRVDNSRHLNSRWYSGSGIYRPVRLIVTDPVHIATWGVCVTTPDVRPEAAAVQIRTTVENSSGTAQRILLDIQVLDRKGRIASADTASVGLAAAGSREVLRTVTVRTPRLWSPETPYLYEARVTVRRGTRELDRVRIPFGIRSLKYSPENGFQLNGKTVKLNGGCAHHDNGCLGAAAFDRAEERKAELLKAAGFNAVRTAHNPPSEAFLDACDRLGLMVIDESFDCWRTGKNPNDYAVFFDDWWRRDLESMVMRDRNHPSIVMWSTGNEIIERTDPAAVETAKMLARCVRGLDPTRPVTSAMTTWDQGWEIFDPLMAAHDVCGYNYQMHRAVSDHERVPSRIILQTESFPRDAFSNREMVRNHPYIIGDFVWTAIDYLGESGIGRTFVPGEPEGESWENDVYPWHTSYCGDIDLTGWRKPVSHYRSMLWNDTEKLYMSVREPNPDDGIIQETLWSVWPGRESWTWPGMEGKDVQVEVVSRYPSVRLFLNGNRIGERPTGPEQEFKAVFTLPYAAGVLKAAGVKDGRELESVTLKTAGEPVRIRLTPDRSRISADGQDLSFVTVEITDAEGTVRPDAGHRLRFRIDGPGVIAGVDNGNGKDPDPYSGTERNAFHGRALVVVRSAREAGKIRLEAGSEGLSSATITLHSEKH
ncbi:MAG: glycoside hydrolase family 2 TIM barrel-domain containing protein [bacterium]|nr:glycoside hydrolase family 2 TIM barrel-domain containing protein [bacterium]